MRPKLLNESMIRIIKKRKKLKKKHSNNHTNHINNGNFYGVLIICIGIICFYLRYIIYNFN